jgi:hypothetical protein
MQAVGKSAEPWSAPRLRGRGKQGVGGDAYPYSASALLGTRLSTQESAARRCACPVASFAYHGLASEARSMAPPLPLPGAASFSRPLQEAPNRYAAKAGPDPLRPFKSGIITRLIRTTPGNG